MKFERCPKCNAAASVPLVSGLQLPTARMIVNSNAHGKGVGRIVHVGKKAANSLCICCRHRWHSDYRLEVK
jgi:hypothetical protein